MTPTDQPTPAGGDGPLARLLGTRGGTASAEAPFVIEHREALIYLLSEAAELEHTIMCQYLYAAFTLKEHLDEGLSSEELTAVTRWRMTIGHVAAQEMLHLALVQNVLSAIGGAPHLGRPNLPVPSRHFPAAVVLELLPFSEAALQHFMFLERPEGMALEDAAGLAAMALAQPNAAVRSGDIVPRPQDFATIGHLYRSIEVGLATLAEKYGESALFIGPPRAQATESAFGWPELIAVTDLHTARQALDTILEQGEGARGAWQTAHFGQFVDILDEYSQLKEDNPDFDPVRPVQPANVRPCENGSDTALISDPGTAHCVDLFNVGYEILLLMLERFFAHTDETDPQLQTLADAAVAVMLRVLRPLGSLITTMPVGPLHPGRTAGPSFELFYESDYLMPHQAAAWVLLEERLRDAAAFCVRGQEVVPTAATPLAVVADALADIADSLAAHFPDWGAVSRFAPSGQTPEDVQAMDVQAMDGQAMDGQAMDGQAMDGQAMDGRAMHATPVDRVALRARVDALAAAVPDAAAGPVAVLFASARALVQDHAAAPQAGAEQIVNRLLDSVLRPLGDALGAGLMIPAAEEAPDSDPLWSLAQTATRLRAALPATAPGGAALIEATAALQDLAVTHAPGDTAVDRVDRLHELQSDVPSSIRPAPDGPYLVTNAEALRDHLGQDLPCRPQMALCRCGESAAKPLCDGSHARIGFSDAPDPHRVPDRLDTYVGQQVTVRDNRGICQHSGLCTDRLSGVFHAGSEPFVTPSGGRMDEIIRAVKDCPSGALSFTFDDADAPGQADQHRSPAIEVTKDGPYRVTGGIALVGSDDHPLARAAGSSVEHYALCRCGQSQNKPFCSGVHFSVGFTDPDTDEEPTMFTWAGGLPALTRMTRRFYSRYVPEDPLLGPLFASMSPDHPERVAAWLGEVFGGPPTYSTQHGGYQHMIAEHRDRGLTEAQRARWVELLTRSAADVGLPNDAEFAAAFRAYLEWGSRLAVENSQPGAQPPPVMPMPRWGWNAAAGAPDSRAPALAPDEPGEEPSAPPTLPSADEPISFAAHVKPLFRERDRRSMRFAFDLWSCDEVRPHAAEILNRVRSGSMPCDTTWPSEWVDVVARWVDTGTLP